MKGCDSSAKYAAVHTAAQLESSRIRIKIVPSFKRNCLSKIEKYLHLKTCDVVRSSTNNVVNPNLKKGGVYSEICAVNRKDILREDVVLQKSKMTKKKQSVLKEGLAVRVMASVKRFITSWQQVTVRISKLKTILPKSTDLD